MQKVQRTQHIVKIQHRLAAAHHDNAADLRILPTQTLVEQIHLRHNLGCRKVAHSTVQTAGAEGTVHITANLTGNAHAVAIIMVHQHRLYRISVRQT